MAYFYSRNYSSEGPMALQAMLFMLGIIVTIFGVTKRRTVHGKWIVVAGIITMFVAVVLVGYGDIKTGFVDALND